MTIHTNQESHLRNNISKVDRYKWIMAGEPGELVYLPKNLLEIDRRYQRNAKNSRVLKLVRRWNWLACGVLTVSRRGGRYYVVDGQHRLMAALKRSDVISLPCLVFNHAEMIDEAVAYLDANRERRPLTTYEQWSADMVAGDEATLFASELITSAGRTPSENAHSGTVRCLAAVVSAARSSRKELIRVWPLAVDICSGNAFHERVIGGLMYLECNLADGQSLSDRRWRDRLLKIGYGGIMEATNRAAAFYAKGGPKVWALGILQEINKGIRVSPLSIRADGRCNQ